MPDYLTKRPKVSLKKKKKAKRTNVRDTINYQFTIGYPKSTTASHYFRKML